MPCSKCGASSYQAGQTVVRQAVKITTTTDCSYTTDILNTWLSLLLCVRKNNLYDVIGYSKFKINVAVGIVKSAINNNPCTFASRLDKTSDLIMAIVNSGQC